MAKRRASADQKLRRMCLPKAVSGKLEVPDHVALMWNDTATGGRDKLISLMVDAGNNKAC